VTANSEGVHAVRSETVEKVVKGLSADAQRGDGILQRADINRSYLRKRLSVAECMAVEERLVSAGYKILENDEDEDDEDGSRNGPRPQFKIFTRRFSHISCRM